MLSRLLPSALWSLAAPAPCIVRRAPFSVISCTSLLPSTPLPYRGVRIDLTSADAEDFAERIGPSVQHWREDGRKSAMLRLPIELAGLAAVAAEHGFEFHHAEGQHCVLKCWLKSDREDKVPPYATHQVGIAGFVLNPRGQLLVVKEWRDTASGERVPSDQWKLPGGLLDKGESFEQGAAREVFEETGVEARFVSILSFWHRHGLQWGKSDIYYVARMEAADGAQISIQEDEISACRWVDLDEFVREHDHPLILAVCRNVLGLTSSEAASDNTAGGRVPWPLAEMVMEGVAWPGRDPFPTYFSRRGIDASA